MVKPKKLLKKGSNEIPAFVAGSLPPYHEEGAKRAYFSTKIDTSFLKRTYINHQDRLIVLTLFVLSIAFKSIDLGKPHTVVFDEVHVIKHINKYIDGEYSNDITPPLSKLVYTFFAYIIGYRGDANGLTKAGQSYEGTDFPYVFLRLVTVLFSSLTLALSFLTLRAYGVRSLIAGSTSGLLLLENLTVLQSRLFAPDTFFLFGLSLSIYSFTRFQFSEPFSFTWFRFLILTSIGLGLSISTKWIGFSTIAWIVVVSALKIWYIVGDVKVSNSTIVKHVISRIPLIIIPLIIYASTFFIHLLLLTNYSRDASLLSTNFQRSLDYNDISEVPEFVTFGSTVTLRHIASIGGYLHSHPYKYRGGTKNNQVTVFDYKDFNNEWIIENIVGKPNESDPRIKLNQQIRLRHKLTGGLLSVSEKKPPISEQDYDFEISTHGNSTTESTEFEHFWIKADVDSEDPESQYLKSFTTPFTLRNTKQSCTILSHDIKLPDWGFNQQEVICIKEPRIPQAQFYIETVKYSKNVLASNSTIPELKRIQPKQNPSFLSKFIELNKKMYRIFKNIKPKVTSEPLTWPLGAIGTRITSLRNSTLYALGNPISFWLTVVFVLSYVTLQLADFVKIDYIKESIQYKSNALDLVLGYILHFLPYAKFEGEWFIHYYLPSLYFGILLTGVSFEFIYFRNPKFGKVLIALSVGSAFYFYSLISPVTFGSIWTKEACESAKFVDTWDFRCDMYRSEKSFTNDVI